MMDLCIASTNAGKIRETEPFLGDFFKIHSLREFDSIPEAKEPFETFLENAKFKAKYYAQWTKMLTFSDDSGLVVRALNGFPGVHTHGFIEKCGGLPNAFDQLETLLSKHEDCSAQFVCISALYDPFQDKYYTGEGNLKGEIHFPAKGAFGFGCDPIFVPEGYHQTLAELGEAVKTNISHRTQSIRALLKQYKSQMVKNER